MLRRPRLLLPAVGLAGLAVGIALATLLPEWRTERRHQTRTFPLAHLDAEDAEELLIPYADLDRGWVSGVGGSLNAVVVRSTPEGLARVEGVLRAYDRPAPAVLLRFQLLEAGAFPTVPGQADVGEALRGVLRYEGYREVDEVTARASAGQTVRQVLGGDAAFGLEVQLGAGRGWGGGAVVPMEVTLTRGGVALLETRLEVPTGETVVLGSARAQSGGTAYVLVVQPEVAREQGRPERPATSRPSS